MQERGLKSTCVDESDYRPDVAPYAGAWIEIHICHTKEFRQERRSLCRSVD